jgi:methionine-S-sulfoxide reductase
VGYSGGTTASPTYTSLGDHTETLQLDYDPQKISYAALLKIFWAAHDPAVKCSSKQYMPVIFYHDAGQKQLAEQTRAAEARRRGSVIHTAITAASKFHLAEDYHQKYYLRSEPVLLQEMAHHYPRVEDLVRSTAAARLNGYVGGYGTWVQLQAELDSLGLSAAGRARVSAIVKKGS